MIKHWNYKNLRLDYSSMLGKIHPSDIDIFFIKNDGTIIFGEIKNESYNQDLWNKQKKLFEKLTDGYNGNAIFLFITHDKYVQNGDKSVDVTDCFIKEYYYKGQWRKPKKDTKFKDVL